MRAPFLYNVYMEKELTLAQKIDALEAEWRKQDADLRDSTPDSYADLDAMTQLANVEYTADIANWADMVQRLMTSEDTTQQGSIFIPFHYREAAANILTNDKVDPDGKIPEFKFCAVAMSLVADD